jgi:hypothetical protein
MMPPDWRERLPWLVARFSHLGISADASALSAAEAWALFRYLSRLAEGA